MNGFYWIYIAMVLFLLGYEFTRSKENKRLLYYSACGFLILIFVVQDGSVSIDIAEYMLQYSLIPDLSFGEMLLHKFELGYVLLCRLLERVFVSERVLLLAVSVLIMLPFCRSYEEETGNPMIALMAFVALGMYMHALIFWRQMVAMAVLTFSFRYIRQRKFVPFLLVVLAAMTFHKVAIVFLPLYFVYNVPISKWLILFCVVAAILLNFLGKPIIEFGIAVIYPRYLKHPRIVDGGYTLLAMLWVITFLSYWILGDKMEDTRVRIPFLMILAGATIQPICFTFFWWLRVVLFFRIALVPMTVHLYIALFEQPDNKAMVLLQRYAPSLHAAILPMYGKRWFRVAAQLILFAVLFVWYESELDGAVYVMSPILIER